MKKTRKISIDNIYRFGCGTTLISLSHTEKIPLICFSKTEIPVDTPVGMSVIDLDLPISDTTVFGFATIESIDNLIKQLEIIKKDNFYKTTEI